MSSPWKIACLVFLFLLAAAASSFGQGVLVNESATAVQLPRHRIWPPPHPPRPPHLPPRPIPTPTPTPIPTASYAVKSLEISSSIDGQIAEVNVSQTFTNTGKQQMEVSFVFPLPYDGAIDSMTLLVDGKEFPAKLLDAKEARKTYEDIVRRNLDPALLEWMGTGMFKTSVFPVPAGASRTVQLKYTQLLRVDGGLTDFLFPLGTAKYTDKPIETVEIHLDITAADEIKNVYSPTHEIAVKRPTSKKATVTYTGKNTIPEGDFRLLYDTGTGDVSTRVLSFRPDAKDDGYFLLLASPRIEQVKEKIVPKTVIFALDHSGSMSGNKIVQAREALKFVLNNLREGDSFNIVLYSSGVKMFKPEIQPFNDETRKEALAFADSIRATGSTNIDAALKSSLSLVQDPKTPSYVIFLSDGRPTVGEMNEMKLAEIAKTANEHGARFFSFGVGYDVNARLLNRFSGDNRGQSEYVKPNEDIEERVARLYNRISSPILTDVTFKFSDKNETTPSYGTNRVYPDGQFDLFAGEQLVIVGRYSKPGPVDVLVSGKVGEESKEFRFEGSFADKSGDQGLAFIPRLWALRRIGEILDQLDLKGHNEELVKELVEISTKYGILTPYTSFLADENADLTAMSSNVRRSSGLTSNLSETTGRSGVSQRAANQMFLRADRASDSSGMREFRKEAEMAMAPAPASAAPGAAPAESPRVLAMRGGGGSFGGGRLRADAESAAEVAVDRESNVQQIGDRAFFQKRLVAEEEYVWVDSTLTEEQQKPENVMRVKQFSDEYFQLVEDHGPEVTPFLALGGTQLLNVAGRAYRIEP